MRVLVTGAAGFVGSHAVRVLRERGDEPIAAVRPGSATVRLEDVPDLRRVDLDLDDDAACARVLAEVRPDAVLHLAWYARPADYVVSPANLRSLSATVRLAEQAFAAGCRKIVAAGTCLEYGRSDRLLAESDPADPVTVYASAKHAAFLVARALADRAGADLAWARIFHLFGPGEDPARLFPMVAASLRRGERIGLTAGDQIRDYLHVRDVASAMVAMLAPGASGIFNVCSGNAHRLREVLSMLGSVVGRPDLLGFGERAYGPSEVMTLAGRADRIRGIGWAPVFGSLEAGLRDAFGGGGPS